MSNPLPPSTNPNSLLHLDPNIPADIARLVGRLEVTMEGTERRIGDKLDAILIGQGAQDIKLAAHDVRISAIEKLIADSKILVSTSWKTIVIITSGVGLAAGVMGYFQISLTLAGK